MRTQVHTCYQVGGKRVPSVTTVLSILAKPALIHWAWDCGCKGLDYRKVRDDKAEIGTLVHYWILCDLKGEKPDFSDHSKTQIDQAETCMLKFWDWKKQHNPRPILIEEPLISEIYKYG